MVAAVAAAAEPTKLRLVADLNPGPDGSGLTGFFVWDGKVWFQAASTQGGKTLWTLYASDGSTAGTQRIKDFPVQERGSIFENPFGFENRLYFQGPNAALGKGSRVWVTDGTEAGTRPISEDGKDVCDEYKPTLIGDRLVLSLHGDYEGHGLVSLNLHTGVTETIAVPFDGWEDYTDGAMLNGNLLRLDLNGKAFWSIDGTRSGLKKLVLPGLPTFGNDDALNQLVSMPNGVLMLPNGEMKTPLELWHTDGKSVAKLAAWWPDNPATKLWFGRVGDLGMILAYDRTRRCGLWSSDGTVAGSKTLLDIDPYKESSFSFPSGHRPQPVVAGGHLFFAMDDGQHGLELWCSDGTQSGTHLVIDIALGNEDAEIFKLFPIPDGRVLFQRKNSNSGTDIWITDGTEDRSQRLAVLKRATDVVAVLKGMILVVSEDDQFGRELYALDVPDFAVPAKPKGQ
jgi:ELWxxDGT repeat protein